MAKVPEDPEIPDFNTFDFGFDNGNIAEVSESVTEAPDYDTFDFGFDGNLGKVPDFELNGFGYNNTVNVKEIDGYCKPCVPALSESESFLNRQVTSLNKQRNKQMDEQKNQNNEDWYRVKDHHRRT